jgi:SNF2 family DNA or RNA helicase
MSGMSALNKKILVSDICYACGDGSYSRGKNYFEQGRVKSLAVIMESDLYLRLQSKISGSGDRQYTQKIDFKWKSDYNSVDIYGTCTCPMNYNCKHVAAACLEYMHNKSQEANASSLTACLSWLDSLDEKVGQVNFSRGFIAYVLQPALVKDGYTLALHITREKKTGGFTIGRPTSLSNIRYSYANNNYIRDEDNEIARLLSGLETNYQGEVFLTGLPGYMALKKALHSGRLFWKTHQSLPLREGEERDITLLWQQKDGNYKLQVQIRPDAVLIMTEPPLYIDTKTEQLGTVNTHNLSEHQFKQIIAAPVVPIEYAEEFSQRLMIEHPSIAIPAPKAVEITELKGLIPVPRLQLFGRQLNGQYIHFLMLRFDYDDKTVSAYEPDVVSVVKTEQGYFKIQRDGEKEKSALAELIECGFQPTELENMRERVFFSPAEKSLMDSAGRWAAFIENTVPELEEQGWVIEIDDSFHLNFHQAQDWDADIEQSDNDWFQMRFNININGRSMPLLPLIMPVLEDYERDELPDMLSIPIEQHSYVNIPASQLKPFLDILFELFDSVSFDENGNGKISRFNAVALADLEQHSYGIFSINGGAELIETGKKLKNFQGIENSPLPSGLQAQLRDYQQKGLNWLQFLREYHFAGILADDMGLGKTVQTLAHLLLEKESGRMDKPCLIIAPTSLMSNWRREAERFTPDLTVLILQGAERKQRFEHIEGHDLILTTYPLLPRDEEVLLAREYHYLILDEAQVIKNPKSQAARIVRRINTRHRLCLTGTPMENHLGELWAQFDFLMPGFLGDNALFKKVYRTPIEVHGDAQQRERLSSRLEPFMLRRSKQEVADELPEKTEIIRSVPLLDKQAALYESIRISMEKKVRDAIAEKGLGRSHIMILDALLKLRQTCCDPRTLSLKEAQKVKQSAKLDLLMEMLPEMLEEGRRILVFSQFTKMLGLIETELKSENITYTKLTGQTRKRDVAIEQFKSGAADVFLISLKAGGVGLNLTEADTVIIYDPWWNPAVESQAADRAHRIGQNKAVFVYKLITEDTVEEKILAMQERKRALAESIYQGGKKEEAFKLTSDDLTALFKPIAD